MSTRLLVITALHSELDPGQMPPGVAVVYCSVGKVNAALTTMRAIAELKPELIINYGTAGRINPRLSGLISIGDVIQRDMMTEPLAPRGITPFSDRPNRYSSAHGQATCATGDSFVTASDPWLIEQKVDLVDMELFAVAAAASEHSIPWRAYKYITDSADDTSAQDWGSKVNHGQAHFLSQLETLRR